jgi:hypothetical protein
LRLSVPVTRIKSRIGSRARSAWRFLPRAACRRGWRVDRGCCSTANNGRALINRDWWQRPDRMSALAHFADSSRTSPEVREGRVEDRRGRLGHAATLRFPSPLIGRVEDWRAGVGRRLCSLLSRPFVCECHTISTMPRFQPPPRRTQRADFLALRSPVCFASRFMGPILQERLSTSVAESGSR